MNAANKIQPAENSQRERTGGLVSVVIPAFNAAKSLARAVDHALGQTYDRLEVIVVNDGSHDKTETVALGYGDRIRYIAHENRGETAARNSGFALAGGEFVTFVDHDDYWEPNFVEKTVRFLLEHPNVVAVSVGQSHRTALKQGVTVRPSCLADDQSRPSEPFEIGRFFDFWAQNDHVCAGSVMFRGAWSTRQAASGPISYSAVISNTGPIWPPSGGGASCPRSSCTSTAPKSPPAICITSSTTAIAAARRSRAGSRGSSAACAR